MVTCGLTPKKTDVSFSLFSDSSYSKLSKQVSKCDPGHVAPPNVLIKRALCGKGLGNAASYGLNNCVSQ